MHIQVNRELRLESITRESIETLYPLFREDIEEVLFDVDEENSASIQPLENIPELQLKSKERRLLYSCLI